MKSSLWNNTRRDMCYLVGRRAGRLNTVQAAQAWAFLARNMERMGELDVPKFSDLITTIRAATIHTLRKSPVDNSHPRV